MFFYRLLVGCLLKTILYLIISVQNKKNSMFVNKNIHLNTHHMIFLYKKIRFFFLKKQNAILTFIVIILGIMPSCAKKYGTESVTFLLNGNIKSSNTNQPINQIIVSQNDISVLSDSVGDFALKFEDYTDSKHFNIIFKDLDSMENGSFINKDTLISFDKVSPNSNGEYTKTIDVRLDPK
jgi:putative lipoprotein (rSAM/lipoprotein system)